MPEERDLSVFKPRAPFKVDDETKAKLPLWKTLYCGKCGKWDTLQAEISTDQDAIRLTCLGCEDQITLPLQLPRSLTPGAQERVTRTKTGYGSCGPCKVHFDTKAQADEHFRTKHPREKLY